MESGNEAWKTANSAFSIRSCFHFCLLPGKNRHAHRRCIHADGAAAVLRQADLRVFHLPCAAAALELLGQLDDLRDAGGPDWMPFAQQAAGGVHGKAAAQAGRAGVDELAALALGAQAERLVGRSARRAPRRRGSSSTLMSCGPMPASSYASVAHTSTVPGSSMPWSQPECSTLTTTRTGLLTPRLARLFLADDHRGRRAVADRRAHRARQRLSDHRRGQHLRDTEHLAELGTGIQAAVKGVLRRNGGELLDRRAVTLHVLRAPPLHKCP